VYRDSQRERWTKRAARVNKKSSGGVDEMGEQVNEASDVDA
jgi:hypothetical protein